MEAVCRFPNDNLSNPCAFACWEVGLISIVYEYANNSSAQCCNCAAAKGGILFFRPKTMAGG